MAVVEEMASFEFVGLGSQGGVERARVQQPVARIERPHCDSDRGQRRSWQGDPVHPRDKPRPHSRNGGRVQRQQMPQSEGSDGSRFEAPHRSGFAHLFEHLMFMGTRRAPTGKFDEWMEEAGGDNNAWTSEDRTDYYDVAPQTALPLLLWLEADRMRDIGPEMTQEKLDAQRKVVENERRQNVENQPYGIAELRLPELTYPEGNPYHHPTIGSHQDLEAATVDDVKDFFKTYYDPANASIVVAGDFDAAATEAQIEKLFGAIPSRGKPADPGAPGFNDTKTTLTSVVRQTVEDNVQLAKVYLVWQSPKRFAPGDAELDLLGTILAGGKASRLYKTLVYDQKIAQRVEASQSSETLGSQFTIEVTARPGASLDDLEKSIDKEIATFEKDGPTDEELTRAKNLVDASFVEGLERLEHRAALLNAYQAETGDPGYLEKDRARYRDATRAGVLEIAKKVLLPNARVVLRVVPKAKGDK